MSNDHPDQLGAYPVERELGRGGMGVVYLARDTKLNRQVAIKVLPDHLSKDAEHLARFRREAMLLASVNHPNVAAVHGVEEVGSGDATQQLLVLEYVPGETLAERIHRGPLSITESVDLGRQIAAGLEAAHECGVIHRDLKPGNVKITPDDQAKVLDFGLARGDTTTMSGADLSNSPTLTYAPTGVGVILGTAGYMSPEQARGKPVDRRTDVWSFGCVLFECLTGQRAFGGETVSDTIARILEREPDWEALPADTPPRLRELLHRCLERDPKKRQRDIGDVGLQLESATAERSAGASSAHQQGATPAGRSSSPSKVAAAAALIFVVGAAVGVGLWALAGSGAGPTTAGPVRLSIDLPEDIRFQPVNIATLGLTPDGRRLLLPARSSQEGGTDPTVRLYQRLLDEFTPTPVPGTERVELFTTSPDSRWLAFVARPSEQSSELRLIKVPLDGSAPPVALGSWDSAWDYSVAWPEDDYLLAVNDEGASLHRISSGGGTWEPVSQFDTGGARGLPTLGGSLPDGRGVFMSMESWGGGGYHLDQWIIDPATWKAHRVLEDAGPAVYATTGHIVFSRGDTLMAAPFDLDRLEVTGEAMALLAGLRTASSWAPGTFALADDGTLMYAPGGRAGLDRRLIVVDESGTVTPFSPELRGYETEPDASADGRRVAVVVPNASATYETWVADRTRPGLTRAAALGDADAAAPVWSPDATAFAFSRTAQDAADGIYIQRMDGTEAPSEVLRVESLEHDLTATDWAADGSGIFVTKDSGSNLDLIFVPLDGAGQPGTPTVLRATPFVESEAVLSPDGRLLAFVSDESGRMNAYLATYAADGTLGSPVRVSTDLILGRLAWTADSRRLFYCTSPDRIMSVTVSTTPAIGASVPVLAYDLDALRVFWRHWDLLPDGRLLAIQNGDTEDDIRRFDVVLNWFDELRDRMGGG